MELHVLQVINGTHYLHLGGDVENFNLMLGPESTSSSDISLEDAITMHQKVN